MGYADTEVAYVLGFTLSRLYRDELERIAATRSRELREAQRLKAEKELREPASRYLVQAEAGTLHSEYVAASLAYFDGKSEVALERLASASRQQSWFYEADLLAGDIHADRYRAEITRGRTRAASEAFEDARASFSRATAVGRSDPRGYEGLCLIWSEALQHRFHGVQGDLGVVRERALDACGQALQGESGSTNSISPHGEGPQLLG